MLTSIGRIHSLRVASIIAPAAIVCAAPALAQEYDDYLGERPERYAMVRHMEGRINVRKWDADEELNLGTPLGEGDAIEGSGRAVIQLGDGTRIAFGERFRLEIATLFDDLDGQTQALFRLGSGRLCAIGGPQSNAQIRIDTPSGSAALSSRSNVSIEVGTDRSVIVKVFSGSVAFSNKMDAIRIKAGDRLTIYSDNDRLNRVNSFNTYQMNDFEAWADGQMALKRSNNSHVPSEIRYYADALEGHGDWVQVADAGWCWRPTVAIDWRPYWRGHWGAYRGGMTWVSYDPFGYVTHHYGRWGWSSIHGWYWIPGVSYSPAWVVWNMADGFFGWAPLGYYNRPVYWGYNNWRHDCWNVVDLRYIHYRNIHNHMRWDRNMGGRFPSYQTGASRPLTPPWRQGPLIVTRQEFSKPNPDQFRSALTREVSAQRLKAYEAQTGRPVVVRRDIAPAAPGQQPRPETRPFEDQSTRRVLAERPILRESARNIAPPSRAAETREPSRMTTPPSRTPETSEPGRTTTPPSRTSETSEPGRTTTPPSRSYEARPASPSSPSSSSRTAAPSSSSPSSSRSSAPPDRSRNSRR